MRLHPQAQAVLDELDAAGGIDVWSLPPEQLRAGFAPLVTGSPGAEMARVENREIPGPAGSLPVRIYTPNGPGPHPVLVYFHGGGFVLCDLDTHDSTCRALANAAGCVVVSVAYRLAPESKFPAAPEDCYAATCWVAEQPASAGFDASRLAVGGDSAGGNLAAVVALMARERGGPHIDHQLLVYPVTDCAFETASYRENAEGYLLTRETMKWFWQQYLDDASQAADPLASPLRAEKLEGLPPATLITAGFDPLRDEGEAYAARLEGAAVPVRKRRFDGMFHGFFGMTDRLDDACTAVVFAGDALRQALRGR